jgi:hypothetical protein
MMDNNDLADKILNTIDAEELTVDQKIKIAEVFSHIAEVEQKRTQNLMKALHYVAQTARDILIPVIRRRMRVLPFPGVTDGDEPNG